MQHRFEINAMREFLPAFWDGDRNEIFILNNGKIKQLIEDRCTLYYRSNTGLSKAGFLKGNFLPLGSYRVDTAPREFFPSPTIEDHPTSFSPEEMRDVIFIPYSYTKKCEQIDWPIFVPSIDEENEIFYFYEWDEGDAAFYISKEDEEVEEVEISVYGTSVIKKVIKVERSRSRSKISHTKIKHILRSWIYYTSNFSIEENLDTPLFLERIGILLGEKNIWEERGGVITVSHPKEELPYLWTTSANERWDIQILKEKPFEDTTLTPEIFPWWAYVSVFSKSYPLRGTLYQIQWNEKNWKEWEEWITPLPQKQLFEILRHQKWEAKLSGLLKEAQKRSTKCLKRKEEEGK
ncbi:MAG: hypothetical protein DRP08_01380 [Candidatus Aenigmatarchaeota archaeon]|nr:MAG: hypothetical protein DRP08_01380 [Candidatus Aenigmarchaeota archaeon]